MTTEAARIEFLINRDGLAAAQSWVERTLEIYRRAIQGGYAATPEYRPLFEASIRDFEEWLALQR
jgi:hypothetical protein